tara:strand:- start:129 stop:506 length:378 start_codon:yes stop_codon:yes gene_type:complete
MILNEKKNSSSYKSISEVAEILGLKNTKTGNLSTHTIRFWEKEFKQIKPYKFHGNRRYYDNKTIIILKKIKFLLKDKGMTIKGVKKQLNIRERNVDETDNISINTPTILKSKITKISKLLKNLKK